MTSSFGNGAQAVPPEFAAARITPEQAEAFAANFAPSWEMNGPLAAVAGTNGTSNGHAVGDLRATAKSNGVHAESHAPPPRTRVSEPEDSVVIDRSITADQIAPPPDSARVRVAPAHVAPAVAAAPPPAPLVVPTRPPPPSFRPQALPPQAPRTLTARIASVDDYVAAPKSKKGLFIGIGAAAAALLVVIIVVVASSGDSTSSSESGGPTITVVKPDESPKSSPPPPAAVPTQTQAAAATTTTPIAAAAPPPPTPVTALPQAAPAPTPRSPSKPPHAAVAPTYNAAPPPRAAQPRSGGGTAIVKDVPF